MAARGRRGAEGQAAGTETLDLFAPRDGQDSGQGQDEAGTEARRRSQRDAILALLCERGQAGVTNTELNAVCFRYGARIFELRRMGHAIETTPDGEGVFRFTLRPGQAGTAGEQPRTARNGRQVRPQRQEPRAAAHHTIETAVRGQDSEVQDHPATGREPYDIRLLDLAHAMLLTRKFCEYPFRLHGREVMCPACGDGMVGAEKQEGLAQHYVCTGSGLVWYGDFEYLKLCLHPAEDVAGRPCDVAT